MILKVGQIMSKQVYTASPDTKIPAVWQIIFKKRVHGVPVVDKSSKLLGIISEEDILSKLYPDFDETVEDMTSGFVPDDFEEKLTKIKNLTAKDIMSRRVIYTRTDTLIMRALSRMIVRKVRQLPVLNDDDKVVGVISKGDIFDNIFRMGKTKAKPKK
jgi:CBS domain-containing protein